MAKRILTVPQAETAKRRAALFVDNVLDDPDRADEIQDESLDEWVEETGRTIKSNPKDRAMAQTTVSTTITKADLQDIVDQVQDILEDAYTPESSREDLVVAVRTALDILNGEDDEDDAVDDDEDDEDDDEDDPA